MKENKMYFSGGINYFPKFSQNSIWNTLFGILSKSGVYLSTYKNGPMMKLLIQFMFFLKNCFVYIIMKQF